MPPALFWTFLFLVQIVIRDVLEQASFACQEELLTITRAILHHLNNN